LVLLFVKRGKISYCVPTFHQTQQYHTVNNIKNDKVFCLANMYMFVNICLRSVEEMRKRTEVVE
jgi:hypothetical protein